MADSGSSRALRAVNSIVAVMFVISAVVQYNDPDPWLWVALYAGAAAACFVSGRFSWSRALAALVAIASFGWATTMLGVLPDLQFADLFKSMQAQTPIIEEGREFLGLMLVGAWTVFLTVSPLRPGSE
jgi:hypothetical protein